MDSCCNLRTGRSLPGGHIDFLLPVFCMQRWISFRLDRSDLHPGLFWNSLRGMDRYGIFRLSSLSCTSWTLWIFPFRAPGRTDNCCKNRNLHLPPDTLDRSHTVHETSPWVEWSNPYQTDTGTHLQRQCIRLLHQSEYYMRVITGRFPYNLSWPA